ncbi:MAG TPA: NAD(P)-dependent oxidoreductase [Alphaproteobacteria bacterium]|nr:NAD(P)-dependent oxidoreductase [Alphaproteobacteria bacterium]
MKIALIGATGVLGRSLIRSLGAAGHDVRAVARGFGRPEFAPLLAEVEPFPGDILDGARMRQAIAGCDAVIHAATAIPRPGPSMDWSLNDRIRREGTANLIEACRQEGVRRYLQQSVTMTYRDGGDTWLDVDAPLDPVPVLVSALDMERLVRASELDWIVLRGGLFYGPDTGREARWRRDAREGRLSVPGDGSAYLSLIHQDDFASAATRACAAPVARKTLNIVDDEPVTWGTLLGELARAEGAAAPPTGAPLLFPYQRVSNRSAKAALDWQPAFPSFRAGLSRPL